MDGTLLDPKDYSFDASVDAVESLREHDIPIVFCSSKTRAEQEVYRKEMGISDPFIVEDGSAVFIPDDYFSNPLDQYIDKDGYKIIELGSQYADVRKVTALLEGRLRARGYSSMTDEEVAELTGLDLEGASLARKREYSETLVIDPEHVHVALEAVERQGLTMTFGGRFHTVKGATDKGKAVTEVMRLFEAERGPSWSAGIGDSENDIPMADVTDEFFMLGRASRLEEGSSGSMRCVKDFSEAARAICTRAVSTKATDM